MKFQFPSPAMLSLGSDLFKLFEVHSWIDGSTEFFEVPIFPEPDIKESDHESISEKLVIDLNEFIADDVLQPELLEMDALGLPLSFNSSKDAKSAKKKEKKVPFANQAAYGNKSASEVILVPYPEMSVVENDSDPVPSFHESSGLCEDFTDTNITVTELDCTANDFPTSVSNLIPYKTKRTRRSRRKSLSLGEEKSPESFMKIEKYWCQRYSLFSRFDEGIEMDEEGWYSVTPESIAKHHASMCVGESVIDCFAGVGGNAIQFALACRHVTAIDIDPNKISYAHHNAKIYDVEHDIDFVIGDFFSLASTLKADAVFMSPPWGGPEYLKVQTYDVMTMLKPADGYSLFRLAQQIANKVIFFLPRNIDLDQLVCLSLSSDPPWSLQVEKNFLNGSFKAITAYFTMVTPG